MNYHYLLLAIISFTFGISAKYADLYNEHGLKEPFKGASYLAGLIWGICGVLILIISPLSGLTYIAHILYWFQRIKLEYPNHATAGVIVLLAGYYQGDFLYQHRMELVAVYLAYLTTGYLHSYLQAYYPAMKSFLRLRLRIYLIPLFYSFYHHNWEPIVATCFGMLGTELITSLYRDYADDLRKNI